MSLGRTSPYLHLHELFFDFVSGRTLVTLASGGLHRAYDQRVGLRRAGNPAKLCMMADGDKLESMRLDEAAARRIIERATELDARLATESTVAQLRDAARDAGISEEAFSRALAEVRNEPVVVAPPVFPPMRAKRAVVMTLAVFLALGMLFAGLRLVSSGGQVKIAEPGRAVAPVVEPEMVPEAPPRTSTKATKKTGPVPKKVAPVPPR